jgi:hypothetical protein
MSIKRRIKRLEKRANVDKKMPVIVVGDMSHDMMTGKEYTGDPDRATVVAIVSPKLWAAI